MKVLLLITSITMLCITDIANAQYVSIYRIDESAKVHYSNEDLWYKTIGMRAEIERQTELYKQIKKSNELYLDRQYWARYAMPSKSINPEAVWTYRFQQASNGLPSFQYDIGMKYLEENNKTNALYWLKKSAEQNNLQAKEALKKLRSN